MMKAALAALLLLGQAAAVPLSDSQEARAQALMREIRCVACENEPISQSASDIAENMRVRVRTMIAEGATDGEVRDWFAGRYGEFVLFRPKTRNPLDYVLWLGPFALLLISAGLVYSVQRQQRRRGGVVDAVAPEDLTDPL
ncbi:MAG: cytochrome c-type biogenesis protein [Pseudomonadota bacterium]